VEFVKQYLDIIIFGLLGSMSFVTIWLVIERYLYFARVSLDEFDHAETLNIALTSHLTTIASIGANAPYIGLLGTVMGILITFYDLGQGGNIEVSTIMLGLALALKATAMGLVVAIPAILFYNALLRRVDVLTVRWKRMRGQ
jgi:biopolymer transport protein ExbB